MKDYSQLFNQGIFNTAVDSHRFCHVAAVNVQEPRCSPIQVRRRSVKGRSFLHLKPSMYFDDQSINFVLHTSDGVSFPSSGMFPSPSSPSSSSTSPSRRTLPLAKPAPLSSLPALPASAPIAVSDLKKARTSLSSAQASMFPHRTSSPAPSSALESVRSNSRSRQRKRSSLSASFFSSRSYFENDDGASSVYRNKRRQDALRSLEGKGSGNLASHHVSGRIRSFVPSVLPEEDEDLTCTSPSAAVSPSTASRGGFNWHLPRSHLSFGSAALTIAPIFSGSSRSTLRSPTTPCFSVSYADDPSDSTSPTVGSSEESMHRRASTGATSRIGWGVNFIELDVEDDGASASSPWRWSHVA